MGTKKPQIQIAIKNKKAWHDYEILDTCDAGIVLTGTEIKSIRKGEVNLKDSFCTIRIGEVIARNIHISPYVHGTAYNHEPMRERKLLMNKIEIRKFYKKVKVKGFSMIPLEMFINEKGLCKLKVGLARGKKMYDKRETQKKKDLKREMERED